MDNQLSSQPSFAGAIAKVDQANRHIRSFAEEAGKWFAKYPYQTVQSLHEDTGESGYYLYCRLPLPDRTLALFIGDALHNLRAGLDHLVSACAIANGETVDRVQFPILLNETGLERRLKADLKKAGRLAIDLVREIAPTPLGNPLLAGLHQLDVEDKHRLILPVTHSMSVEVTTGAFEGISVVKVRGEAAPPIRTSCFIPAPPGYEQSIAHDFEYTGDIIFPAETPFPGMPCLETLNEISWSVADIIAKFERAFNAPRLSHCISRQGRRPISA